MDTRTREIIAGFSSTQNYTYLYNEISSYFKNAHGVIPAAIAADIDIQRSLKSGCDVAKIKRFMDGQLASSMQSFAKGIELEMRISTPLPGVTIIDQITAFNNQFIQDFTAFISTHVCAEDLRVDIYAVGDGLPTTRSGRETQSQCTNDTLKRWWFDSGRGVQSRDDPEGEIYTGVHRDKSYAHIGNEHVAHLPPGRQNGVSLDHNGLPMYNNSHQKPGGAVGWTDGTNYRGDMTTAGAAYNNGTGRTTPFNDNTLNNLYVGANIPGGNINSIAGRFNALNMTDATNKGLPIMRYDLPSLEYKQNGAWPWGGSENLVSGSTQSTPLSSLVNNENAVGGSYDQLNDSPDWPGQQAFVQGYPTGIGGPRTQTAHYGYGDSRDNNNRVVDDSLLGRFVEAASGGIKSITNLINGIGGVEYRDVHGRPHVQGSTNYMYNVARGAGRSAGSPCNENCSRGCLYARTDCPYITTIKYPNTLIPTAQIPLSNGQMPLHGHTSYGRHYGKDANYADSASGVGQANGDMHPHRSQEIHPYHSEGLAWDNEPAYSGIVFCDQTQLNTDQALERYEDTDYKAQLNNPYNGQTRPHELTQFGVSTQASDARLLSRRIFRNNEAGEENGIPRYEQRLYRRNIDRDISEGLRNQERGCMISGYDMSSLYRRVDHKNRIRADYHADDFPNCGKRAVYQQLANNSVPAERHF